MDEASGRGAAKAISSILWRGLLGGIYLYIMTRSTWRSSVKIVVEEQRPGYISIAPVKPIDERFFRDLVSIYASAAPSSPSACGVSAGGGPPLGGPPALGGGARGLLVRVESGLSNALLFSSCSLK